MDAFWEQEMESKSIKKSMFFLIDFLEAPKTLRNHRGSSGGAPVELRVSPGRAPGGTLSPGRVPRSGQLSKNIEYKQQTGRVHHVI